MVPFESSSCSGIGAVLFKVVVARVVVEVVEVVVELVVEVVVEVDVVAISEMWLVFGFS